jgi:hypothetical protein
MDVLDTILDTLIPPSEDGRMPGAGSLGISEAVAAQVPGEMLQAGLAAAGEAGLVDLDLSDRVEALRALDASQPGFVPTLYFMAVGAYYAHPEVLRGLGLEPRPPHPQGYAMEVGDLGALDRVRARGRLWREAP